MCARMCSGKPARPRRRVHTCMHTHTYDSCSHVHRCLPATLPVKAKRSHRDRVTVPRPGSRLGQASAAGSSISSQPTVTSRSSLLSVTSPPSPLSPAAGLSTSFCFLFLTVWWNPPEAKGPAENERHVSDVLLTRQAGPRASEARTGTPLGTLAPPRPRRPAHPAPARPVPHRQGTGDAPRGHRVGAARLTAEASEKWVSKTNKPSNCSRKPR